MGKNFIMEIVLNIEGCSPKVFRKIYGNPLFLTVIFEKAKQLAASENDRLISIRVLKRSRKEWSRR